MHKPGQATISKLLTNFGLSGLKAITKTEATNRQTVIFSESVSFALPRSTVCTKRLISSVYADIYTFCSFIPEIFSNFVGCMQNCRESNVFSGIKRFSNSKLYISP